jgi:uncharacterized protein (TIGR02266 family)
MTQRPKSGSEGEGSDDVVPAFIREHTRYPVELAVRLRCDSWKEYIELYTSNFSRGGLFVASERAAPMGSLVTLELSLPDGEVVALRAQVVHVVDGENGPRRGMGVMFHELGETTRRTLETALQTARAQQPKPAAPPPLPEEATRAPKFSDAIEQALTEELARRTGLAPRQQLGVLAAAGDAEVDEAYRQLRARYAPNIFTRYGAATRAVIKSINELLDGARRQIADGDVAPVLVVVPEKDPPTAAELEQRRRGDEARQSLRAGIERRLEEASSHRDMGRVDDAIRGFEALLSLDRKHDYAKEELRKLRELKAKKKR